MHRILNNGFTIVKVKRTPQKQKRVDERFRAGLCLYRDASGKPCDCPATNRGRCNRHYQRFAWMRAKAPNPDQFDADAVADGDILGRHEICDMKRLDPDLQRLHSMTS